MRIGIVGNREGWSREFVFQTLNKIGLLTNKDIIISGGAEGVDTYAQEYAERIGAQIRIFYPDPEKPSPQRYYDRNEQIAENCDKLIAFDREELESSGTRNTIQHAEKRGKEVIIIKTDMIGTRTKRTKGE